MTIRTARIQRPCSGTLLMIDGSRSGILLCVEIAEGFKSPLEILLLSASHFLSNG
jgi:hypothetical protein